MSIAKRLFGGGDSDTVDEEPEEEQSSDSLMTEQVGEALAWLESGPVCPAYDMTREQSFKFPETVTISSEDGETGIIHIDTPTTEFEFTVRLSGYTSRFGELDVTYISVGGYAINLYHQRPDSDEYFVRRLYYYEDEQGIGGEQHSDSRSEPHSPDWSREDIGESVVVTNTDAHLRVYDWRENMLTHDKPTPKDGEVVFRYQDSPNAGGNRSRTNIVITASDIQLASGETLDVDFIEFDADNGEFVLYAESESKWYIGRFGASEQPVAGDISWSVDETHHRPSQKDSLVWVRDPKHTWMIPSLHNQKSFL